MKRCDHQVSPIRPRWLRACRPPSTAIGAEGGGHHLSAGGPDRPKGRRGVGRRGGISLTHCVGRQGDDFAELVGGQFGDPTLAGTHDAVG